MAKWIGEEEYDIHGSSEGIYKCLQENYINMAIVKQIATPVGRKCFHGIKKALHDLSWALRTTLTHVMICKLFLILCSSFYDYVKDCGIGMTILHYDIHIF